MLTQLVDLLENKENSLSLSEISRAMNAQPSAVMSMIELLVRKGRLIEIGPDGQCCGTCGQQSDCNLLVARGKRYTVNRKLCVEENRVGGATAYLAGAG